MLQIKFLNVMTKNVGDEYFDKEFLYLSRC